MIRNEDGSAVLSKEELQELNIAYQKVVDILDGMPSFLGDYCKNMDEYANIRKWEDILNGEEFIRSNWIDDDDEDDDESEEEE
jgi:hypothetical protein